MEVDEYNRMKLLYDFYDMYNGLKSKNYQERNTACTNLLSNTANYNESIDDYYANHPDLYKKISYVKDLIEKVIKNSDTYCKQIKTFKIPLKFLEDEEKRKQEEADKIRKQLEAERQKQKAEEDERQRRQPEAELEAEGGKLQMPKTPDGQREIFNQGDPQLSVELGKLKGSVNLEAQQHSKVLPYRLGLDNSGILGDLQEGVFRQQDEDQSEEIVNKRGDEYANADGSLLRSLRLPSAITEVLGSVDPVPVVGVSGGMGALFLLFRVLKNNKLICLCLCL
ncbi:hypothetical protein PVMG_06229 [Plasmodium vivax Mauritania I]|uniref:Uncharacterized protein n=1 Tax=Plasmodium vivax Mauritania I TaxID=1035515 RepID=A0A0J9TIL5_PLAVI|nr:hypothetical protein PVMG_06229 [Plasmodium vivax Mauritania I]